MPTPSTNCQGAARAPIQTRRGHQQRRGEAAEEHRRAQREPGRDGAFGAVLPRQLQVELDAGDPDEEHHRPPGDAVQRLHHLHIEDRLVDAREGGAEQPRPEQDAGEDLHHHQRRPVVGAAEAPDEVGQREDDPHRDQEEFSRRDHAVAISAST